MAMYVADRVCTPGGISDEVLGIKMEPPARAPTRAGKAIDRLRKRIPM